MALTPGVRKRAPNISIHFLLLLLVAGCGGPNQPAVDLESPPHGTNRDQLRTAMAQERPIFFETFEGERFYGELRGTYDESFVLLGKRPFEGESILSMSDRMQYEYWEIRRAEPIPEEGNSTRAFALGTTVLVVGLFAVVALIASFPVPSS